MKTIEILNNAKKNGIISEREILLLKRRKNNGEEFDESIFWDGEIMTDENQAKKGYNFLINQWKTSRGLERKNNPFGYREQDAINSFVGFRFVGFHDLSKYDQNAFYVPIYECIGNNASFQYYYYNGVVNIIG